MYLRDPPLRIPCKNFFPKLTKPTVSEPENCLPFRLTDFKGNAHLLGFFLTFYFVLRYSWLTNNVIVSGKQRRNSAIHIHSQVALVVKNPSANWWKVRDSGLIPGSERSPEGGHGNPLQYSCLENPMDRGAWQATVQSVTKSCMIEQLNMARLVYFS